jgi:hypothetical protein
LTLYVLPSSASDHLTIRTTFRNGEGDVLGETTMTETVTLWQQLFLVFVMPFKFPPTVTNETIDDLFRASLVEAASKGYL